MNISTELARWLENGDARRWRETAKPRISRRRACEQLGVDESTLRRWEEGQVMPTGNNARIYHQWLATIRPADQQQET
jgi:DNA-binding transcriptional regulator YiaG